MAENPEDQQFERGTPEWWLHRLGRKLEERVAGLVTLQDYYDGKHPLAYAGTRFRAAFGGLFRAWSDNFCALVPDAVEERLNVEGFRFPDPNSAATETKSAAEQADKLAWELWQRNGLDADSHLAHITSLVKGAAYGLVWDNPDDDQWPLITVEDPTEAIVEHSSRNRRIRLAGLKRWREDDDTGRAVVYLPDGLYKYKTNTKLPADGSWARQAWVKWEVDGEQWPIPNRLQRVPLVPLYNRPKLAGGFESELAQVIPIQGAINKMVADMMIAAEYGAFRQRYAVGLELEEDPETGEIKQPFVNDPGSIWTTDPPAPGVPNPQFGEFSQTDLRPYVAGIEMMVQHLSSRTRTPPHYLLGQSGAFPSGESLKAAETGLVAKTRLKFRPTGEAWEDLERMGFLLKGDKQRGGAFAAETIWRNPESRTMAETVDAALKMSTVGVPQEALWEFMGFTPQQIERFKAMRAEETLLVSNAFGAPPPGARPPGGGTQAPPVTQPPAQGAGQARTRLQVVAGGP